MNDALLTRVLVDSNRMLLNGQSHPRLLGVLLVEFVSIESVYIINWIPEQGEDIYIVAAPPNTIATVEVPREEGVDLTPTIKKVPFDEYRLRTNQLSKESKRKLAIVARLWSSGAYQGGAGKGDRSI